MTMTEVKYKSGVISTEDIPYLALTGELWGVFCEHLGENWPHYNGTALYVLTGGVFPAFKPYDLIKISDQES